jgi:hypothetical protein
LAYFTNCKIDNSKSSSSGGKFGWKEAIEVLSARAVMNDYHSPFWNIPLHHHTTERGTNNSFRASNIIFTPL